MWTQMTTVFHQKPQILAPQMAPRHHSQFFAEQCPLPVVLYLVASFPLKSGVNPGVRAADVQIGHCTVCMASGVALPGARWTLGSVEHQCSYWEQTLACFSCCLLRCDYMDTDFWRNKIPRRSFTDICTLTNTMHIGYVSVCVYTRMYVCMFLYVDVFTRYLYKVQLGKL